MPPIILPLKDIISGLSINRFCWRYLRSICQLIEGKPPDFMCGYRGICWDMKELIAEHYANYRNRNAIGGFSPPSSDLSETVVGLLLSFPESQPVLFLHNSSGYWMVHWMPGRLYFWEIVLNISTSEQYRGYPRRRAAILCGQKQYRSYWEKGERGQSRSSWRFCLARIPECLRWICFRQTRRQENK